MTSTFILTPSKTFRQCIEQPCIYHALKGSDRCKKYQPKYPEYLHTVCMQTTDGEGNSIVR